MRGLRPLLLPQLVEIKRREERASIELDSPDLHHTPPLHMSHSSMSSDPQSPATPTFSPRAHSRFPSTSSSLASSPTMRESIDGYAPKRPLTEVKEEPQQEKEEDFEMLDIPTRSFDSEYPELCSKLYSRLGSHSQDLLQCPVYNQLTYHRYKPRTSREWRIRDFH